MDDRAAPASHQAESRPAQQRRMPPVDGRGSDGPSTRSNSARGGRGPKPSRGPRSAQAASSQAQPGDGRYLVDQGHGPSAAPSAQHLGHDAGHQPQRHEQQREQAMPGDGRYLLQQRGRQPGLDARGLSASATPFVPGIAPATSHAMDQQEPGRAGQQRRQQGRNHLGADGQDVGSLLAPRGDRGPRQEGGGRGQRRGRQGPGEQQAAAAIEAATAVTQAITGAVASRRDDAAPYLQQYTSNAGNHRARGGLLASAVEDAAGAVGSHQERGVGPRPGRAKQQRQQQQQYGQQGADGLVNAEPSGHHVQQRQHGDMAQQQQQQQQRQRQQQQQLRPGRPPRGTAAESTTPAGVDPTATEEEDGTSGEEHDSFTCCICCGEHAAAVCKHLQGCTQPYAPGPSQQASNPAGSAARFISLHRYLLLCHILM